MRIGIILARGGSRGIPLKNIKRFLGRPLIYWTLDAAYHSILDEIIVVTDHPKISRKIDRKYKNRVRIAYKAMDDEHTSMEGVQAVIMHYKPQVTDVIVLLQCTSPYTSSADINNAVQNIESGRCDSIVTCGRIKRFLWSDLGFPLNYSTRMRPRRQEWNGTLIENGALYASRVFNIVMTQTLLSGRVGMLEQSHYFELDTPADWAYGIVEMSHGGK